MTPADLSPRSLLYVPASNARALAKAPTLAADMVIIDLEDAVPPDQKAAARAALAGALATGFGGKRVAVRVNDSASAHQAHDLAALAPIKDRLCALVVPKVDRPADLDAPGAVGLPLLAMIETPAAVFAAQAIAADARVAGLVAGLNDLAHALRLPPAAVGAAGRGAMMTAIQTIVLAARAADKACFDSVWNAIDDVAGFTDEAQQARSLGFDGKTLVHPAQIAPCHAAFAPSAAEIEDARAVLAAAADGAQRFRGRMIEAMHVAMARALIARADLP